MKRYIIIFICFVFLFAFVSCKTDEPHVHEYVSVSKTSACIMPGVEVFRCECGEEYSEIIEITGHSWSEWVVKTEPTETEKGTQTRQCSFCGKTEAQSIAPTESEDSDK